MKLVFGSVMPTQPPVVSRANLSAANKTAPIQPKFAGDTFERRGITVQGVGSVRQNPDLMQIFMNIQSQADSEQEVATALSEKSEALLKIIKALKLPLDLKSSLSIRPNWSYVGGEPKQNGHIGTFRLQIAEKGQKDVEKFKEHAARLMEAAVNHGAQIEGPSYSLEDYQAAAQKALTLAIEDARRKAQQAASVIGFEIDETTPFSVEIGVSGGSYSNYRGSGGVRMAAMGESARISPDIFELQPIEVNAPPVTIRFEINQKGK